MLKQAVPERLDALDDLFDQRPGRQLAQVLRIYVDHYNIHRPHRALGLRPPTSRAATTPGQVPAARSGPATGSPPQTHPRIRRSSMTDGFTHPKVYKLGSSLQTDAPRPSDRIYVHPNPFARLRQAPTSSLQKTSTTAAKV